LGYNENTLGIKAIDNMTSLAGESIIATPEIIERLRELKPQILRRFRAKEIQLFGSCIRAEQTIGSDIDILIDFEDDADLFDLSGLAIFLEEELTYRVDIVPKKSLRIELQKSIMKEALSI
jgi:predicted nucleotidyltransferase